MHLRRLKKTVHVFGTSLCIIYSNYADTCLTQAASSDVDGVYMYSALREESRKGTFTLMSQTYCKACQYDFQSFGIMMILAVT